jgi:hypothetical protein
MFPDKAVGNFRYLATVTPWRQKELESLDRYWRQGFKTAWWLNESTTDHPWTTPKSMAGMGYTTTSAVLSHALWLCTSKEEMTREAEARSCDETVDNVWHRIAMCDHLLEFKTWRHDDPKPLRGISYATVTRHLRILRKRLEKLMGKCVERRSALVRSAKTTVGTIMAMRNNVEET